jgi:hypothetical protein
MAGKTETLNLVNNQKQIKWRATARATTEVKEKAGKSATSHGSAEAKKWRGKFYATCVEGGKWRENPKQ